MQVRHLVAAVFGVAAAALVAGFMWMSANAAPLLRSSALAGIAVGVPEAEARISGRYLDCADAGPSAASATCSLLIAGAPLRVEVSYTNTDHVDFSRCQVTHGDRQAACSAVRYAVQSPPLARIDAASLGLTLSDVTALEAQYPGSGLAESGWSWFAFLAALGAALLVAIALAALTSPQIRSRRFAAVAGVLSLGLFFAFSSGLMFYASMLALID